MYTDPKLPPQSVHFLYFLFFKPGIIWVLFFIHLPQIQSVSLPLIPALKTAVLHMLFFLQLSLPQLPSHLKDGLEASESWTKHLCQDPTAYLNMYIWLIACKPNLVSSLTDGEIQTIYSPFETCLLLWPQPPLYTLLMRYIHLPKYTTHASQPMRLYAPLPLPSDAIALCPPSSNIRMGFTLLKIRAPLVNFPSQYVPLSTLHFPHLLVCYSRLWGCRRQGLSYCSSGYQEWTVHSSYPRSVQSAHKVK